MLVQIEVSYPEGKKKQYKNAIVYWLPDFEFHQSVHHRISVTIHFNGYVPKSFLKQNRLTLPSPYPLSHTGLIQLTENLRCKIVCQFIPRTKFLFSINHCGQSKF